jgi:hypothetical protein
VPGQEVRVGDGGFVPALVLLQGGREPEPGLRVPAGVGMLGEISEKEALKTIQEVDEKRAAFQEQCTSTRWGDGNEYDLCIDTGKIGIENAVEMILEYIRFENIF